MARRPLKKSEQGRKKCFPVRGPSGGSLEACVTGRRYGFVGRVYAKGKKGGYLPLSTGNARTLATAVKNAKRQWTRARR